LDRALVSGYEKGQRSFYLKSLEFIDLIKKSGYMQISLHVTEKHPFSLPSHNDFHNVLFFKIGSKIPHGNSVNFAKRLLG